MKYLRKFNTEADVMMFVHPNVVLVTGEGKVDYNVPMPNGVFIQHIDGNLYTAEQWTEKGFTNDEANGVAVLDTAAKFVIYKENQRNTVQWSPDTTTLIEGVTTGSSSVAKADYNGAANTAAIVATGTGGAAYICSNKQFPNGQKGYLPAVGEMLVAYNYKSDVDIAMALIGGDELSGGSWSSTQRSATEAYFIIYDFGNVNTQGKNNTTSPYVTHYRPFTTLLIP